MLALYMIKLKGNRALTLYFDQICPMFVVDRVIFGHFCTFVRCKSSHHIITPAKVRNVRKFVLYTGWH